MGSSIMLLAARIGTIYTVNFVVLPYNLWGIFILGGTNCKESEHNLREHTKLLPFVKF